MLALFVGVPMAERRLVGIVEDAIVDDAFPSGWWSTAARGVLSGDARASLALPLDAGLFLGHRFAGNTYPWLEHARACIDEHGELRAIAIVRAELAPWALGYGDPLKERVDARRRGRDGDDSSRSASHREP